MHANYARPTRRVDGPTRADELARENSEPWRTPTRRAAPARCSAGSSFRIVLTGEASKRRSSVVRAPFVRRARPDSVRGALLAVSATCRLEFKLDTSEPRRRRGAGRFNVSLPPPAAAHRPHGRDGHRSQAESQVHRAAARREGAPEVTPGAVQAAIVPPISRLPLRHGAGPAGRFEGR